MAAMTVSDRETAALAAELRHDSDGSELAPRPSVPPDRPDSDAYLEGVQWPPVIMVGPPVLALTVTCAMVLAVFLVPEGGIFSHGDTPSRGTGPVAVGLVIASGIPWAHWLWRRRTGPESQWFAVAVLAPIATVSIGGWFSSLLDLGSFIAYQLGWFCVLLVVMIYVAGAPRREAAVVVAGSYGVLVGALAASWWRGAEVDPTGTVSWNVGFGFALIGTYAVRRSLIASVQASDAREALAWQAAADERRRIARDVHDVVAHTLAVTMLHITAARMAVRRSASAEAEEALEEAERHGRASLADIRRIVRLLRSDAVGPTDTPQPGLADVPALIDGYRVAGLKVDLRLRDVVEPVSPVAELAVYRVLQEALTNAARHGTGPATVEVGVTDGEIALSVDNPGERPTSPPATDRRDDRTAGSDDRRRDSGSGLVGMRERIAAAGGTLDVGPRNGRWIVRARVPAGSGTT